MRQEMATADEDIAAGVILYLSPEPHHLPLSMSAVPSANNSISDVPVKLSINCDAVPASSEPVQQSYVVSSLTPARQDNPQCSDESMIVETQLDVTAESMDSVSEHCTTGYDVSAESMDSVTEHCPSGYLTETVLTTETTASCGQNVGQSKVSDLFLF